MSRAAQRPNFTLFELLLKITGAMRDISGSIFMLSYNAPHVSDFQYVALFENWGASKATVVVN